MLILNEKYEKIGNHPFYGGSLVDEITLIEMLDEYIFIHNRRWLNFSKIASAKDEDFILHLPKDSLFKSQMVLNGHLILYNLNVQIQISLT